MKKRSEEETITWKVGRVTQYDAARKQAELKLSRTLRVGDCIHITGPRSNWWQSVKSMRMNNVPIVKARSEQIIWLEVIKRAYKDDEVFILLTRDFTPLPCPESDPHPRPGPDTPPGTPAGPSKPPPGEKPKPPRPDKPKTPDGKKPDDQEPDIEWPDEEWPDDEWPDVDEPDDDDDDDENDEPPDLPDSGDFPIDSEEKEKEGGEGG